MEAPVRHPRTVRRRVWCLLDIGRLAVAEEPDRQTSTARSKEAAVDLNVGVAEALATDYFYIRDSLDRTCPDLELAAIGSSDTGGQGCLTL